jgi:hypothetical protein
MYVLRQIFEPRFAALIISLLISVPGAALLPLSPDHRGLLLCIVLIFAGIAGLGLHDVLQTRHAILRNYPILAHLRFFL